MSPALVMSLVVSLAVLVLPQVSTYVTHRCSCDEVNVTIPVIVFLKGLWEGLKSALETEPRGTQRREVVAGSLHHIHGGYLGLWLLDTLICDDLLSDNTTTIIMMINN